MNTITKTKFSTNTTLAVLVEGKQKFVISLTDEGHTLCLNISQNLDEINGNDDLPTLIGWEEISKSANVTIEIVQ